MAQAVPLQLVTDVQINAKSSNTLLENISYMKNVLVTKEQNEYVIEKRCGYENWRNRSGEEGYGLYYWQNNTAAQIFTVESDGANLAIYKSLAASPTKVGSNLTITTGPSQDSTHVSWAETDASGSEELAVHVHDADTGENVYMINAAGTTNTRLTNATHGFPAKATYTTIPGVVELDGYLFVGCLTGEIFNSNLNDPYTWTATDFLSAERYKDQTKYICKHNNNIVAMGSESIEFFYNAGNPTGSPLSRREDIFYDIGLMSSGYITGHPMADSNDSIIAYIGSKEYGGTVGTAPHGVYLIENFQLKKISTPSIDKVLRKSPTTIGAGYRIKVHTLGDRTLIFMMSEITMIGDTDPIYVYDTTSNLWYIWSFNDDAYLDIWDTHGGWFIAYTSGGLYSVGDNSQNWKYVDGDTGVSSNIYPCEIVTYDWDGGVMSNKFIHSITINGEYSDSASADNIAVSWSDDGGENFSTARNVDQRYFRPLHRCGVTRKRKWKLVHDADDNMRIKNATLMASGVPYVKDNG